MGLKSNDKYPNKRHRRDAGRREEDDVKKAETVLYAAPSQGTGEEGGILPDCFQGDHGPDLILDFLHPEL